MKCSLGISNFLFFMKISISAFNVLSRKSIWNSPSLPLSVAHLSTPRVPSSCAFELLDAPPNSPAVLSPCLLLSPSHPQLCRSNNFFFPEHKSDNVIFFHNTFQWLLFGTKSKLLSFLLSAWLPSFSDVCAWSCSGHAKWKWKWSRSVVSNSCDPMSMGFSRQEYWSGLPFPFPEDLPNIVIEHRSPTLQADPLLSEPPGSPSP